MNIVDWIIHFYNTNLFKTKKNHYLKRKLAKINDNQYTCILKFISYYEDNLPFLKLLRKYVLFIIFNKIISYKYNIFFDSSILFINSSKVDKDIFKQYSNIEYLQPKSNKYYNVIIFNNPTNVFEQFSKYIHFINKQNGIIILKIDLSFPFLNLFINILDKYSKLEFINNDEKIIPNLDLFSIFFVIYDIKDIKSIISEIKKINQNKSSIDFIDIKFQKYINYTFSKIDSILNHNINFQIENFYFQFIYLYIYQYYLKNDYYFIYLNKQILVNDKKIYNDFLINNIFTSQFNKNIQFFYKKLIEFITIHNCKTILEISKFENTILHLYILKTLFLIQKEQKINTKFYSNFKYKDNLIDKKILLHKNGLQHLLISNENIIDEMYFSRKKKKLDLIYFYNISIYYQQNFSLFERCIHIIKINGFIIIFFDNIEEKNICLQFLYLNYLEYFHFKSENENEFETFIILQKKKNISTNIKQIKYNKSTYDKDVFHVKKFKLITNIFVLNQYSFEKVFVISAFEKIDNNILLQFIIHSLKEQVLLINQIPSHFIHNVLNINVFDYIIFKEHYLGKNFHNLISIKDFNKKKMKHLIIFTNNYSLQNLNFLYFSLSVKYHFIQKIFILKDILNLVYHNIISEQRYITKDFIYEWLSYFELSRKNRKIILINYNQFLNYKFNYIRNIFYKLNIQPSYNFKFDFNIKLDLYKQILDNELISYIMNNFFIIFILQKYFNGKSFIDHNILLLTNYTKISLLFYINNTIQLKPYWDIWYSTKLSSSYMFISNEQNKNKKKQKIFYNTILLEKYQKNNTILDNLFELFKISFIDTNNEFFILINENYIPSTPFFEFYQTLLDNNKNYIDILKIESKKNIVYHSLLFILNRNNLQKLIDNEELIKQKYNENTFLSFLYFQNKNNFISSKAFLTLPEKHVDSVFPNINHHQHFFTGPFLLSNDELYLENYIFDTIFIVSGLQRSGNHMFIKLIIESLPENVLFINDFNVNNIQEIFNINLHSSFIYQGHYLSKNIHNLISNQNIHKLKKIKYLLISTEEFTIQQLEIFYQYLHKYFKKIFKIFILRDILNLTASRIQFETKRKYNGFPMYIDKTFKNNWYDYLIYSQNQNNNIISLNYNLFITQKLSYFNKQLSLMNITYNKNIILEQTLFGDGSSFKNNNNNYLERYLLLKHNFEIKKLLSDPNVIHILNKYFAGKYYL